MDVHTGGARPGVMLFVLSENSWKSSVTLLAARTGSIFSKKLIQRCKSLLASSSFRQPWRSRWLSSWSPLLSLGWGDARVVISRVRKMERRKSGLRILLGWDGMGAS